VSDVSTQTHPETISENASEMAYRVAEGGRDIADGESLVEVGADVLVDGFKQRVTDVVAGSDVAPVLGDRGGF
jgi:hypothetical protein